MHNVNAQKTVWYEMSIQELEIVIKYFNRRCEELELSFSSIHQKIQMNYELNLVLVAYDRRRQAQLAQAQPTSSPPEQESATAQDWFTFMGIHFLLNGDFYVPATYADITDRTLSQSEYEQASAASNTFYHKWRQNKEGCEDATIRYELLEHFAANHSLGMNDIKRSVSFDADTEEFSLVAWSDDSNEALQASHASKQNEDDSNDNPAT